MLKAELRQQDRERAKAVPAADRDTPARLAKFESQTEQGRKSLLLTDPQDVATCQKLLAGWRAQRDELTAALSGLPAGAGPDLEMEGEAAMRERMTDGDPQTARAALGAVLSEVGLQFHSREGGKGRVHFAGVRIQPKSEIRLIAGNRI